MASSSFPSGQPVFRFAPSPNGRLHLGHALSALTNERFAARMKGRLLLRIEDIDRERCTPVLEQAMRADLDWLGIVFEPEPRRQSEHFADYGAALSVLQGQGLIYPCFCSRQQVRAAVAAQEGACGCSWPADPDGAPLYTGTCRAVEPTEAQARQPAGEAHVLRLDMTRAIAAAGDGIGYDVIDEAGEALRVKARPTRWGDVVLARRDIPTSYHLSVVVDDALQGVTHVVRGRDLEAATDIHALLQRLLGLPTPFYHFHELLIDESGRKLAKSRQSESLADLRAQGVTAAAIREKLGFA
ncbi:glutamyl-Q tRNA(Asp) ligase [Bosea sp. Root381]|uniref:tRNA glutamyl-Q(34) synthetase GluQRS n=1 Tax=Bosea sp. Root381 TaxID=1736524 RepID=UPI0006F97E40|nr:tRNA glutamyl-Q(34) synthetase GluQRS [Bosea sp. Root381]KRE06228.1 glutamyl-Q tRNA(Asp) ligase [Bosea sp. Root381]